MSKYIKVSLKLLSLTMLTIILSARDDEYNSFTLIIVGALIAICIWGIALRCISDWKETVLARRRGEVFFISAIAAAIWLWNAIMFFLNINNDAIEKCWKVIVGYEKIYDRRIVFFFLFLVAFYGAFVITRGIVCLCYRLIVYFVNICDRIDKVYFLVWILASMLLLVLVYRKSTAFYAGGLHNILYTFDSSVLYKRNVYMLIGQTENDIRQSLFAVASLPISIPARMLSRIMPFEYSYAFFLQLLQDVLLGIGNIIIVKMMKVSSNRKPAVLMFLSVMCETVLFSLLMEQYIILVFCLIITVYCIINRVGNREVCAVASVGTAPTNFLLLFWEAKNRASFVDFLLYGIKSFLIYVGVLTCFGQFGLVVHFYDNIMVLMPYAKHVGLGERIRQYLYFIRSCFLGPASYTEIWNDLSVVRMSKVVGYSWIGIAVAVLVLLAIYINRRDLYGKICASWFLFSIVLLVVIGFNSSTNDYFLFVHYFGWAFASLLLMGLSKTVKRDAAFNALMYALSGIMVVYNSIYFAKLINFAIKNYAI